MGNKPNKTKNGSKGVKTGTLSIVLMGVLVVVVAAYVILRIF